LFKKNGKKKSLQQRKRENAPIALCEFGLQADAPSEGTHRSPPPRHSAGPSEHKSFIADRT
jgi:hypothetical protein